MRRFDLLRKRYSSRYEEKLARLLESRGWKVSAGHSYGTYRPDLIATNTSGRTYVFEVKGSRFASFADVAQTKAFQEAVGQALKSSDVEPVLVLVGKGSTGMEDLASGLGVHVLHAGDDLNVESDMEQFLARMA